ncbi:MAG TPA: amylo-alpha-1,6-glucosidase, partial [Verrucomicrobiae bacterium]|nr:amylo-alpha-1,6-glucosidase [Verrucomicrobiae bacterium]
TAAKQEARKKFLTPLLCHLAEAGLGHVSEIADAESPHTPRGCPFQAWSVGEALRLDQVVLAEREEARTSVRFTAPKTGTSRVPIAAQPKKIGALPRPRATRQRDAVTV